MSRDVVVRRGLAVAYVGYLIALFVLVFDPSQQAPGASLSLVTRVLNLLQVPVSAESRALEFVSNVALFVPFGLLGGLLWRNRRLLVWTLAAAALSTTIEVCQLLFLPHRFGTVSDVVANTAGSTLGALLVRAWSLALRRRRSSS